MFESLQPPSLSTKLRTLCLWPYLAFVIANLYFEAFAFFPRVSDWLYPLVGVILIAAAAATTVRGTALIVRNREELSAPALLWAIALALGIALSTAAFFQMIRPWLAGSWIAAQGTAPPSRTELRLSPSPRMVHHA